MGIGTCPPTHPHKYHPETTGRWFWPRNMPEEARCVAVRTEGWGSPPFAQGPVSGPTGTEIGSKIGSNGCPGAGSGRNRHSHQQQKQQRPLGHSVASIRYGPQDK